MGSAVAMSLIRRVVLVSLDWCRPKDPPLSLGAASILTSLRKAGIDTTPLSYNVNKACFHVEKVVDDVFAQRPNRNTLLGIGAFVWNERHIQKMLTSLKEYHFPGKILLGGPQISYCMGNLERYYPQVDIFCRGFAEEAVVKLVTRSNDKVPHPPVGGIVYKGLPDLKQQATCDLGSLPSPFLEDIISPQKFIRWETQRGCPFRCSFCQHRESSLPTGSGLRIRRPLEITRVVREAEWICRSGIDDVAVLDPTFNSGPNYLTVLDSFIQHGFQGKIALQCRFEMVKDEFLLRVLALNSQGANCTLEFGLQTVIKAEAKAIQRPNNLKKIEEVLRQLRTLGIPFEVSLIFGLPLQTLHSFKESVNYCLSREVPVVKAWPLMILRGTPLDTEEQRRSYGLVERAIGVSEEIDRIQVDIPHVVASSTFSEEDWLRMGQIASLLAGSEGNHPSSV